VKHFETTFTVGKIISILWQCYTLPLLVNINETITSVAANESESTKGIKIPL